MKPDRTVRWPTRPRRPPRARGKGKGIRAAAVLAALIGTQVIVSAQTLPWVPFPVYQMALQPDGKVLISGRFDQIDGVPRTNLARLNLDGSLDRSFVPDADLVVRFAQGITWLAPLPNGKMIVAGWAFESVVRLEADGRIDPQFQSETLTPSGGLTGAVGGAIQGDGSILIFGQFGGVSGEARDGLARLDSNGVLDRSFGPRLTYRGFFVRAHAVTVQEDGKILISGGFDAVDGMPLPRGLARLNPDGSVDATFNPSGDVSFPSHLAATPDGKVYVGHQLGAIRLNSDGSRDETFNPGFGIGSTNGFASLGSFALQSDGRLLLGGNFGFYDGIPRAWLARVLSDGSLDADFDAQLTLSPYVQSDSTSESVWAIALGPDHSIVIAGIFTGVGGIARSWLARLDASGKADPTFNAFRPIILEARVGAGGLFTMRITGEMGRPYRVEQSSDLSSWSPLRNFLVLDEWFDFVDVRPPALPRVFYRVASDQ